MTDQMCGASGFEVAIEPQPQDERPSICGPKSWVIVEPESSLCVWFEAKQKPHGKTVQRHR
jgi:hypothetical protein